MVSLERHILKARVHQEIKQFVHDIKVFVCIIGSYIGLEQHDGAQIMIIWMNCSSKTLYRFTYSTLLCDPR